MGVDCLHAIKITLMSLHKAQYAYKTKYARTEFTLAPDALH